MGLREGGGGDRKAIPSLPKKTEKTKEMHQYKFISSESTVFAVLMLVFIPFVSLLKKILTTVLRYEHLLNLRLKGCR